MPKADLKVVHVVGPTGSGKGTALDYLKDKYGFETCVFSKVIKDETAKRGFAMTRDNLYKVYDDLKREFGDDVIAKTAVEEAIKANPSRIAFDGARHPAEIDFVRKTFPGVLTIYIDCKLNIRKDRIISRKRESEAMPEDELDRVILRDLLDCESCKILPGITIIENNGTVDEFKQKLDTVVRKF